MVYFLGQKVKQTGSRRRLLLLFTFIVFVPVHVLLTLYLEYDLIIIII